MGLDEDNRRRAAGVEQRAADFALDGRQRFGVNHGVVADHPEQIGAKGARFGDQGGVAGAGFGVDLRRHAVDERVDQFAGGDSGAVALVCAPGLLRQNTSRVCPRLRSAFSQKCCAMLGGNRTLRRCSRAARSASGWWSEATNRIFIDNQPSVVSSQRYTCSRRTCKPRRLYRWALVS